MQELAASATLMLSVLAYTAAALLIGRLTLSVLPPGRPGGHGQHELPVTLATTCLLTMVVIVSLAGIRNLFSFNWDFRVVLGLGSLAAALRFLMLPAAMVPRHEPARERPTRMSTWIGVAALAVLLWAGSTGDRSARFGGLGSFEFLTAIFGLVFILHGLETARSAPWMRSTACLIYSIAAFACRPDRAVLLARLDAVSFVAGGAFTIAWLRRGDRRARVLAVLAYVGTGMVGPSGWMLALAGLLWLVLGTPRPARSRTALIGVVALVLASPAIWLLASGWTAPRNERQAVPFVLWTGLATSLTCAVIAILVVVWIRGWSAKESPTWNSSGAPVGQEERILSSTVATALLLQIGMMWLFPTHVATDPLSPALTMLALICGLALKRFERTAQIA